MKKILCVCICAMLMLSLVACESKGGQEDLVCYGFVFEAEVREVNEESIVVMPVAGSNEANAAMNVGLVVIKTDRIPEVKVGDRVRIDYDGIITRSIPGQLGEVYSFEIIQ